MNFGAGGYYSRQTYSFNRHVDAWAYTARLRDFSLAHALELSGQFYRAPRHRRTRRRGLSKTMQLTIPIRPSAG